MKIIFKDSIRTEIIHINKSLNNENIILFKYDNTELDNGTNTALSTIK